MQRVKIRRTRASGLSASIALLIICAMVYILTLSVKNNAPEEAESAYAQSGERITKEVFLEGGEYYIVHFGMYKTALEAQIQSSRLSSRGAAGYVHEKGGAYYAAGNMYSLKEDAESAKERITAQGEFTDVLPVSQSGVRLRITASEAQIASFESAYKALIRAEEQLFSCAQALDTGQTASNARAHIAIIDYEFAPHLKRIQSAVGRKSDLVCMKIADMCHDALSEIRLLTKGGENEMYLASEIRNTAMRLRLQRLSILKGA